ncbi:MAG TPA: FAD-dependent oxidoreductase [Chthoniobacteraceae bacterium]|nr:FAD-dependent oxidoreductase [Chthoniobacteraceae bacterium]
MNPETLFYYRPTASPQRSSEVVETDICIYGATPAGIAAAIAVHRAGGRAVIAEFGDRVGGLTASGLGATDIGNKFAIGGIAREFYRRLGARYGEPEAWMFEPHAAEALFLEMLDEAGVPVHFRQALATVRKEGNEIREMEMEDGTRYRARYFIDASYEGDLMAQAGVSYTVGREANAVYDELLNGIQFGHPHHNFRRFVDPYRIAGDPRSGLCAGIDADGSGAQGERDRRVQAYNFRLCLTNVEENRLPFPCPPGYDPERYELLRRYLATGVWDVLYLSRKMPHGKTDTNNYGGFSTDHIGANHEWPEAGYARREEIFQDHVTYTAGLLYFLANDPGIPAAVREEVGQWGLAKDEFTATGGWPHALYIREARRMVSDYVMSEHDAVGTRRVSDGIGLAAYTMDSHHCRRVVRAGRVCNEGDVQVGGVAPYPISYRSLCPSEAECANLLVPWCLAASHIAFGSIRMEPVGMVLGHSAAVAALHALRDRAPVQRVSVAKLQEALRAAGQVLEVPPGAAALNMNLVPR